MIYFFGVFTASSDILRKYRKLEPCIEKKQLCQKLEEPLFTVLEPKFHNGKQILIRCGANYLKCRQQ